MKTAAFAFTIATLFASAAASAQEGNGLTRAQVIAEYHAAVAAGNGPTHGELYSGTQFEALSTKSREQVRAEVLIAQQRGELVDGEQYPGALTDIAQQGKTRAQVRAELAAYRQANPGADDEFNM